MSVYRNIFTCGELYDKSLFYYTHTMRLDGGPGSGVSIATGYRLDGPGIESRWGRNFPHLSKRALGPTQFPVQWVPRLSRRQKAAGACR
jgi:hypothetical protein